MPEDITTGNTITDGKEFRFRIVGRVEEWCRESDVPFDAERFGLRNSSDIEVKWGIYKKGEVRTEWASCSEMTGMGKNIATMSGQVLSVKHDLRKIPLWCFQENMM